MALGLRTYTQACQLKESRAHPARETCFVRAQSALVTLDCMSVLLCARDAMVLGTPISAGAHVDIIVRVPKAVQNHPISKLWAEHGLSQLLSDMCSLALSDSPLSLVTGCMQT